MRTAHTAFKSRCIFQMLLCGSPVQISRLTPSPADQGENFLAFRETRISPIVPLFSGITRGGARRMIADFQSRRFNPTSLVMLIGFKMGWA